MVPHEFFIQFFIKHLEYLVLKLGYEDFMKNPSQAKNKIVILINQVPDESGKTDIHDIPGYGWITGSEILCNIMLQISR